MAHLPFPIYNLSLSRGELKETSHYLSPEGGWGSVEDFGGRVTNFSGGTERGIVVTNNKV